MADFSVTEPAKARDNARLAGAARGCGVPASDRGGSGRSPESAKARDNARLAGAARGCGVPASDRGGSGLWGPRK